MRLSVQRMASKRQPFHSINRHASFGEHGELDPDLHLETLEFFPKRSWTGFHGPCIQLASIDFERSQEPEVPAPDFEARGCSSAGRAPDLHSGGRRFDPDQLHQSWGHTGPVAQMARAHP